MAAGSWNSWTQGDIVTNAKFQDIQDSIVFIYASDAAANSALTNKVEGTVYFNTTDDKLKVWDGSAWIELGAGYVSVNYLVVAGGGSGGSRIGAGGGAGGLRSTIGNTGGGGSLETPLLLEVGVNYTVTVGAGGSAVVSTVGGSVGNKGNSGSNSVFSTVTSTGGGGGGAYYNSGDGSPLNGGSGGGGEFPSGAGGTGTANQGYAGGNVTSGVNSAGGGGAGALGSNAAGSGGSGGVGVISNILSSTNASTESVGQVISTNVYYAGGGGGSPGGSGANGGGGNATGNDNSNGTAGTTNTGGGGGGARNVSDTSNVYSGAGGSGVVILSYPDAFTINIGAGLTAGSTYTSGGISVTPIKSGTGNVSWSS